MRIGFRGEIMPVLIDRGSNPWRPPSPGTIEVGLLNNMPDAALEATERQFAALLQPAAENVTVRLRRFSLPGITRGERAQRHLDTCYAGIDELWDTPLDALIVTGTEPRAPALQDEPYWSALTEVVDWASNNTVSTIWSCLAAHAAVLHLDGVERRLLPEKCIGVFDCATVGDHPLTHGLASNFAIPHSRHNELPAAELAASGYQILSHSQRAGADTFIKQDRSLFVFFQGHPEYEVTGLLGEYRRDLGRYLRREREIYPAMPRGYFDDATVALLTAFRARALAERSEELIAQFPLGEVERAIKAPWKPAAARIYRNWLTFVAARKQRRPATATVLPLPRAPEARVAPRTVIERRRGVAASGALWRGPERRRVSALR